MNENTLFEPEEMQLDESGEVHLSEVIRKIQIPSEKWDELLLAN